MIILLIALTCFLIPFTLAIFIDSIADKRKQRKLDAMYKKRLINGN